MTNSFQKKFVGCEFPRAQFKFTLKALLNSNVYPIVALVRLRLSCAMFFTTDLLIAYCVKCYKMSRSSRSAQFPAAHGDVLRSLCLSD